MRYHKIPKDLAVITMILFIIFVFSNRFYEKLHGRNQIENNQCAPLLSDHQSIINSDKSQQGMFRCECITLKKLQ